MKIIWNTYAWEEYLSFQQDTKKLKKINDLIKSITRNGYKCIGKPEPLKENLSGFWSVRIDKCNRLVFTIEKDSIIIIQCGTHYKNIEIC